VSPVVALTYRPPSDVPPGPSAGKIQSVGAVLADVLQVSIRRVDWSGKISRCGDEMMLTIALRSAQSQDVIKKWSIANRGQCRSPRRRGNEEGDVALARRLPVIMHRILG